MANYAKLLFGRCTAKQTRYAPAAVWMIVLSCMHTISLAQSIVKGTVTGTSDEALPGVTISVKDATTSTITDKDGKYSIELPAKKSTLLFSYVGYVSQEHTVNAGTIFDVRLSLKGTDLNSVVVVGYGAQRKRDLTGAASSIKAKRIENEKPQAIQDILRGNIAGLDVGYSASAKGEGALQIRGDNTLKTSSAPLIVLDGIIYYGALSDINPNDIESIDVLKDASSAAVFGSRAANGVIQVTTKKGRTGKSTINLYSSLGVASMAKNAEVYGPYEFIAWRQDVLRSMNYYNAATKDKLYLFDDPSKLPAGITLDQWRDGKTGEPVDIWLSRLGLSAIEINNYKAGKYINWNDLVYQSGMLQDHNVSLSGKKNDITYYFSLGLNNNEGIIVGDEFTTIRSRINLDAKITNWLNIGINTQFSKRDESNVNADWPQIQRVSPWGNLYKDDGKALRISPIDDLVGSKNPIYDRNFIARKRNFTTLNSSIYTLVKLPLGITYQLNFSPYMEYYQYYNHESALHEEWARFGGRATREQQFVYTWQVDNLIKWNKTINGIHQVDVTLLANAEKYQSWQNAMSIQGFSPTDALSFHNFTAGTSSTATVAANDEYSTGDALMARVFYSLKNRYMLTLSGRRDGYSAFGLRNPRAFFPSAALAWVFTEEKIGRIDWLTFGKLRFSWGENGNREVGRYAALSSMSTGKYPTQTLGGTAQETNMLIINNMANPNLKWERSRAINIGADFSIKNGLLEGSLEVYKTTTHDLLIDRKLPDIVGFSFVTTNLGEIENKGVELTLNSRVMEKENFSWTAGLNFSINRNKIVHLYGDMTDVKDAGGNVIGQREADDITNRWFIGHALDEIWDPVVLGVWQLGEEAAATKYNQFPGDFKVKDLNNSGTINQLDHEFQGFTSPRFRWNMRHEFTFFRNIDLAFSLYSYWGHKGVFNQAKNTDNFPERNNAYKTPYWTPNNPINDYSRIRSAAGGINFNVYRNKSFIRLATISLAYTVPAQLLSKARLGAGSSLKIFGTVRNAAYWAPEWNFYDPEASGPNPRFFNFGMNLTL